MSNTLSLRNFASVLKNPKIVPVNKHVLTEVPMKTAALFNNGQNQALHLPKPYRFQGEKVYIKQSINCVILIPMHKPWDSLFKSLGHFSNDFMNHRN